MYKRFRYIYSEKQIKNKNLNFQSLTLYCVPTVAQNEDGFVYQSFIDLQAAIEMLLPQLTTLFRLYDLFADTFLALLLTRKI